ncbi:hypothetical protein [Acinetobacter indicus]|uniref:hypothetical protein n=1 Tax=Acinetobacter indicus TaxID=756892 RepID=UPI002579008C|nr:hypothetical protein [Acinetobacter indicus]MDM1329673.1 hypothetical protein [Acinetobacter indicus]MDM1338064.1 hypothetical protein [Acinetobacter indicus]
MNNWKIILCLNLIPLSIGIASQLLYYFFLKKYFVFSFYEYKKDLGVALLAYSIAMFGIVATISTIVYGLEKIAAKNYLHDFGKYYFSSWCLAILYLILVCISSVLLIATISNLEVTKWLIRLVMFFFIASLFQALSSLWTGMKVLRKP